MIKKIKLKNFKCHKELSLDLKSLNVFSGLNSAGKSTVIQSILLCKQSEKSLPEKIWINGDYVLLGKGSDILLKDAEEAIISMEFIDSSDRRIKYNLEYGNMEYLNINPESRCNNPDHDLLKSEFEYLNAERISPKSTYDNSSYQIQSGHLGIHGENTAHYLIQDSLTSPLDNGEPSLRDLVDKWIHVISPNITHHTEPIKNTELSRLTYKQGALEFRPINVGFGVTYILPVIVALLKAKPESILIIENPEAHLHPQGQRKMGELIAQCANAGVQIFIETHSDHVMNGIRIATKQKKIGHKNVGFFHFYIDGNKHECATIKINEKGKLDYWPEGFFDEWDRALDEIL